MSEVKQRKTRGRKPTAVSISTPVNEVVEETPAAPAIEEPVAKRGRGAAKKSKKTNVVAVVTPEGIVGSLITDARPLIAHIPISSMKTEAEPDNIPPPPNSEPDIPNPYDTEDTLAFIGHNNGESGHVSLPKPTSIEDARHFEAPYKSNLPTHYSERLMVQFQDSNRVQQLPERTDVYCFWCCHPFDTVPCVIPADIKEGIWHVYGNFCSPECATSYLFHERLDSNVQWERCAMLNSLYTKDAEIKAGALTGIRSAPKREVLRIFGGSMDIREFRAILHEKKLRIDVLTPPMVSIIQTMDTKPIDFYDQSLRNVFVPTEARRLNAPGAQGLRLRRSKPIAGKESTLDWVMKIAK